MGSFSQAKLRYKKKLSGEGVGEGKALGLKSTPSPNSTNSPTGSENGGSLDRRKPKKKVGQNFCENPYGMHFYCKHCDNAHCGGVVYRTLPCHARFEVDCPYCAKKWRKKVIANFSDRIKRMIYPAFVTLTLKKGGVHVLQELNGLSHRCRKYVCRKKKDKNRCKRCGNCKWSDKERCNVCGKEHRNKPNQRCCNKCSNTYAIRAFVSCIEPPNHVHAVWDCDYIPQHELSDTWELVTKDSFVVDIRAVKIRKVEKHRWKCVVNELSSYISQLSYYVSQICKSGSNVDLSGVHVVNSWGDSCFYEKLRMRCKKCGCYLSSLKYDGSITDYVNDPVDFVVSNKGPPLKYLRLLSFITGKK